MLIHTNMNGVIIAIIHRADMWFVQYQQTREKLSLAKIIPA